MTQDTQERESGGSGFVDSLREIQGEYVMLGELYEKQKSYGERLAETMRTLQFEVDQTIPIRPEAMGKPCRAAYLVSEAVVVVFDMNGAMTSKPLSTFPPDTIISVIQECTPELQRLLSEKRRAESSKVKSMERVLKELKEAQATFKQTRKEDVEPEEEEIEEAPANVRVEDQGPQKGAQENPAQQKQQRDSFTFRGNFGDKRDIAIPS